MRYSILFVFIGLTMVMQGQDRLDKFELTYQNSKKQINSQEYTINFNMVYDGRNREKIDKNSNVLIVNGLSSKGQLKSVLQNKSDIDLNGSIENYKVKFDDATKHINISYDLNSSSLYKVQMAIKANGNVILSASSDSDSPITWIGRLRSN
ncbi:DUF4251 domain-containing protein [Winogradskyella sp. DF17]|uniref:DUF4251 domain-containing protein n=1 Tax=Winogradskyella pelagia TaxID=2819984 RepID=A0ABS3T2J8_9FLAO|nr:DUF4251 domain-containing protein [Winogradskyella sp. DF17]MBO3116947.1 DUF4251 domain-containing protein [Winogradskyella sp. DF17]